MTGKNNLPDKLPPQNIEAEKSVLGSLLLDKESIHKVADILIPEDFYTRAHQIIYENILKLVEKREPIDILNLSNSLQNIGQLSGIGGSGYLTTLVNSVNTSAHIISYANIVQRKKVLRDMITAAHDIIGLGHREDEDIENLLDEAEQKLFSISQRSVQRSFEPLNVSLKEAFERLDRLHKDDGTMRGVPTGFYDLDNILAGLQKSDMVVLAARPSLGKSTLALDIARNIAAKAKQPVGFFTLEMSRDQVVDRLIAAEANVNAWNLRTGKLSSEGDGNDFEKIMVALDNLSKLKLFIDDTPSPTILQLRAMARRLQAEHGLGLIVLDYLQLIKPQKHYESSVQQITEISRSIKGLARELNVPVLALSQLSRAVEARPDQRPKLSDLRESGSIEQDADVVMFIYREDRVKRDSEKKNIAEIIVAKHRNGPVGEAELYFDDARVTFKNLAKNI
ncbi:MAG: replicative DNA helicase [bacterium]|nr:replicative DNA helicase [bacterium]